MRHFSTALGVVLLAGLTLSGCGNYNVSVNERSVYTPPALFKDYQLADEPLRVCVRQTIEDARVTRAGELEQLNCASAGIETLEGLGTFRKLEALNLPDNQLSAVDELARLSRLRVLILRDNDLQSAEPLLSLLRLERLDLTGNPDLDCRDLEQLAATLADNDGELKKPEHCR